MQGGREMEVNQHIASLFRSIRIFPALILVFVIIGCSDSPNDTTMEEPKVQPSRFTANVSGAVNGEVSGTGIVTYLGPRERDTVTGNRPGYFLIANINTDFPGERGFTITFRIPDKAQPGNYALKTPDPRKVGENFDVRVERVVEGKLISYQTNTDGTITLSRFSPDRAYPDIGDITGTFQFVTENSKGDRISANGAFEFPLKKRVVTQNMIWSG